MQTLISLKLAPHLKSSRWLWVNGGEDVYQRARLNVFLQKQRVGKDGVLLPVITLPAREWLRSTPITDYGTSFRRRLAETVHGTRLTRSLEKGVLREL